MHLMQCSCSQSYGFAETCLIFFPAKQFSQAALNYFPNSKSPEQISEVKVFFRFSGSSASQWLLWHCNKMPSFIIRLAAWLSALLLEERTIQREEEGKEREQGPKESLCRAKPWGFVCSLWVQNAELIFSASVAASELEPKAQKLWAHLGIGTGVALWRQTICKPGCATLSEGMGWSWLGTHFVWIWEVRLGVQTSLLPQSSSAGLIERSHLTFSLQCSSQYLVIPIKLSKLIATV